MAFAKLTIIGNAGRDPEMRYTPNGRAVTSFSVAVSYSRKGDDGEWVDEGTDWYAVTVWGDRGESVAERVTKGTKVLVSGRFRTRTYERRDGTSGLSLDITADDVIVLSRRDAEDAPPADRPEGGGAADGGAKDDNLDDLPF